MTLKTTFSLSRRVFLTGPAIAIVLPTLAPAPGYAHSFKAKNMELIHPWTYEQDKPGGNAIVGMEIRNLGKNMERLIAVECFDAQQAEIKSATLFEGKPVVEIPPGGRIDLHAKGPHILLTGMKTLLAADTYFQAALLFETAGVFRIDINVEEKR